MAENEENMDIEGLILLGFIVALVGFLAWKWTGNGAGQLSPQFWAGVAVPLLAQLIRKKFNLKRPGSK